MSQRIHLMWIGGPANSSAPLASVPLSFGELEYQLPYSTLRVIDDPSAVSSTTDILAEATEIMAAIADIENREIIPWERIKRELKL